MAKITPILMSGGAGTRLWPLSRRARPKQFHALGGDHTLIQETALRFATEAFARPMVIGNAAHADLTRAQLAEVGVTPMLILEPEGRNTGAARGGRGRWWLNARAWSSCCCLAPTRGLLIRKSCAPP